MYEEIYIVCESKRKRGGVMNGKTEGIYLALGWMYAEACSLVEKGEDIREKDCESFISRALKELSEVE